MLHQSEAYFEHCHSADWDDEVTLEQRRQCWSAWLEHYASDQPPARVRYAKRRLSALRRGSALKPLPDKSPQRSRSSGPSPTETTPPKPAPAEHTVAASDPNAADSRASDPTASDSDSNSVQKASSETASAASTSAASTSADSASGKSSTGDPAAAASTTDPSPRKTAAQTLRASPPYDGYSPCLPVCTPPWNQCVARCGRRGTPCLDVCESEFRMCMRGCY